VYSAIFLFLFRPDDIALLLIPVQHKKQSHLLPAMLMLMMILLAGGTMNE
jgi:hypothetical protein